MDLSLTILDGRNPYLHEVPYKTILLLSSKTARGQATTNCNYAQPHGQQRDNCIIRVQLIKINKRHVYWIYYSAFL